MLKQLFIFFFVLSSLHSNEATKDAFLVHEALFRSLSSIENNETKETIYQHIHSIFNFKAHDINFLIPLSTRLNGNYGQVSGRNSINNEIEFQLSVKYDFAPNLLGLGEIYSLAYTQHSFWQYYVGDAYFRASDYKPEIFVTIPLYMDYLKALRLSVAHTSNGLGIPNERAWNYATLNTYFQYKTIFTEFALWYRFNDNYDYNPKLIDTMGYGHIKFLFPYKKHFFSILFRNNFAGKGAIDASYTYPFFSKTLFLYIKGFSGYGESMSSYAGNPSVSDTPHKDDYVQKIGFGFSISR